MPKKRLFYLLLAATGLLAGCTAMTGLFGDGDSSQGFSAYAEDVFRRQNNATSEVMTLSPDELDDAAQYEALLSAEKNMQSACELLNDYAQRSQDGENAGLLLGSRAGFAVKDCDRATHNLETLLENIDVAAIHGKRPIR